MQKQNREVWWSSQSHQDLEGIAQYLYQIAPRESAEKLIHGLLQAGEDLSSRALLWPIRAEVSTNTRSVSVRPYSIFYRASDSEVEIIRVLHGHRNVEELLRMKSRNV